MKNLGILALAAAVLGGANAWAASDRSSSPNSQTDPLAQQGENKRLRYAATLLKRNLSETDAAICKRKAAEGNKEELDTCHVTRNYLADIFNKTDEILPLMISSRFVVTKEEWEALKAKS